MIRPEELAARVRQIEIRTRRLVNQIFSGEYHSVFKGRGMTFSEVREYQLGDDIRSIDWNVTARFGHPFIKVFEEERELTVILLVDLSGSQQFGTRIDTKLQVAVEMSGVLAFSALKNNDKVGMILFTDTIEKFIPPRKSRSHILRLISELLQYKPSGRGTNLKAALEYLNHAVKKKSIIFLLSDFIDSGYEQMLRVVGRKHDLVCIDINDAMEEIIPSAGLVDFTDPETGMKLLVDTSDKSFRAEFAAHRLRLEQEKQRMFTSAGIDKIAVRLRGAGRGEQLQDVYLAPLVNFFKLREKRW